MPWSLRNLLEDRGPLDEENFKYTSLQILRVSLSREEKLVMDWS